MKPFSSWRAKVAYGCTLTALAASPTHLGCSSDSDNERPAGAGRDGGIIPGPPEGCDVTKPFGAPVFLASANKQGTDSGAFSYDELTFYSMNARERWFHIYNATRSNRNADFGEPTLLNNVNGPTERGDYDPFVSYDGLELVFASERDGTDTEKSFELYYATRASTTEDFSTPLRIPNVNSPGFDRSPTLSPDKSTLYFMSTGYGVPNGAIYKSVRSGPSFGAATRVDLGTTNADASPVLSPDGLTLFFGAVRDGGKGGHDVWMASRTAKNADFTNPTNAGDVVNLNSASNESPRWISPDGCRLYLASQRPAPYDTGAYDGTTMWVAARPK